MNAEILAGSVAAAWALRHRQAPGCPARGRVTQLGEGQPWARGCEAGALSTAFWREGVTHRLSGAMPLNSFQKKRLNFFKCIQYGCVRPDESY